MNHTPAPRISFQETMSRLRSLGRPEQLEAMARFGLTGKGRIGASMPALRTLARSIGKDQPRASQLWETGIPDAMILAALTGEPEKLPGAEMDRWVAGIPAWDVCDQACSNLFDRTPVAWKKIRTWSARREEFVRRAGYVLIAALAVHDRTAGDEQFTALFPIIRRGASDNRNFVRKAVCWSLRQIGKRNEPLRKAAVREARALRKIPSPAARWIAAETLRELENPRTVARLRTRRHH